MINKKTISGGKTMQKNNLLTILIIGVLLLVSANSYAQFSGGSGTAYEPCQGEKARKEIAFVDITVANYQTLVDGIGKNIAIYEFNTLNEIANTLSSKNNLDAVHIFSHGSNGEIIIGNSFLNTSTLNQYAAALQSIGHSLNESGDILLYGCNIANGKSGKEFVDKLASLTHADIIASDNFTGAKTLSGDWDLEFTIGNVDTDAIKVPNYKGSLTWTWSSQKTLTYGSLGDGSGNENSYFPGYDEDQETTTFNATDFLSGGTEIKTISHIDINESGNGGISKVTVNGSTVLESTTNYTYLSTGTHNITDVTVNSPSVSVTVYYVQDNNDGSTSYAYVELYGDVTAYSAPTVTNNGGATGINATTATLKGEVTDTGGEDPTVTIYYGDNDGGTNTGSWDYSINKGTQSGTFSSTSSNLDPNTTYYYRCYAENSAGSDWANATQNFTTLKLPVVTTEDISNIGANTATANGNIDDLGNPNPDQHGHCWSTSSNPDLNDNKTTLGSASTTGAFDSDITGLSPGQTYYVRAYATNDAGTSYGSEKSFTTLTPGLWTGSTSSDWNTASNWDDGNVPTSTVDVTIPSGCSNYPIIDESAECKGFIIENGGEININSSYTLEVSGDFTLNDESSFSNSGTLKFSGTSKSLNDNRSSKISLGNIQVGN